MASAIAKTRARFKRKVKTISPMCRRAALEAMLKRGADVTELMKRLAPKRTGALEKSIGFGEGDAPKTKATGAFRPASDKAYNSSESVKVSIWAGDDRAYYVKFVEFGTKSGVKGDKVTDSKGKTSKVRRTHPGTPPQPFFWPAWRAKKKSAKSSIVRAANKALKEAAKTP